jgi:hypothetical protein
MQLRKVVAPLIASLALSACTTMDYRLDQAMTPIEVIESNYVESTLDAEIVLNETPDLYGISGVITAA